MRCQGKCLLTVPKLISLTGDRAQDDDSKHDSHYNRLAPVLNVYFLFLSCLLILPLSARELKPVKYLELFKICVPS